MKTLARILVFPVLAVLAGCATPYQDAQWDGGSQVVEITPSYFYVWFRGNSFTGSQKVADFAMLKACETALAHGFPYFSIVADQLGASTSTKVLDGGTAFTSVNVAPQLGTATVATQMYGTQATSGTTTQCLKIDCYKTPPANPKYGKVYDAAVVAQKIRAKYRLSASR